MNYYPGIEQSAVKYLELQEKQRKLLEELQQKNPSLFTRMMRAGLLAFLGIIGAGILEQDILKGAVAGAAAGAFLQKKKELPWQFPFPTSG